MNTALWIVAGLLAAAFVVSGTMKLVQPKKALVASGAGFLEGFSAPAIKAIGVLELLDATGLVLPAALDIVPVLVPLAAVGLTLMVVAAVVTQVRRHETQAMAANAVLIALAVFVAWGRLGPQSFTG